MAESSQEQIVDAPLSTPGDKPHNLGARVFQNAVANIGGRGFAILFSTAAAIVLARYLGSERLGEYGAIYAYLALFSWLAAFGFEPVLVREMSRDRGNASGLMHTAIVLSCFLSVAAIALAVLLAPMAGYGGRFRALLILAGVEYILTPLRLPALIFQVDLRQWYGATINVVRQGVWLGIIVVLWLWGGSLTWVIAGRVASAAVEACLMWAYSRKFFVGTGTTRFLRERAMQIFSHSSPIAFAALLSMIYLRIDQVMLHKMTSDAVLGPYVAAAKVSELFELVPSALMFSIAPVLAVSVQDSARFRNYTDRAFRYFLVGACALSVFMTVGARIVVRVLYGKQFLPAAPLLAVLIWSEIPVFFAAVVINILIARNQQNLLPIPTLVGAAVNVALNVFLIPRYAAAGAAWATLVSYTIAWMACLLFFKQTTAAVWQGLRFALPLVAMAVFAVVCSRFVPGPEAAKLFAACGVFALGVWVARFITMSDLDVAFAAAKGALKKA